MHSKNLSRLAWISWRSANIGIPSAIALVVLLTAVSPALAQQNADGQLPVAQYEEPLLLLLRDPVVHQELKLTKTQQAALDALNDEFAPQLLSTRNKSAEQGMRIARDLIAQSRQQLKTLLNEPQRKRLEEIELQVTGLRGILRKDVSDRLVLTEKQRQQLSDIIADLQKDLQKLQDQAQAGESLKPLEAKYRTAQTDAQKRLQALLKPDQRTLLTTLIGRPADLQRLGRVKFKAPELVGAGPWVNSDPLTLKDLQGKVVVLHFWTFGCSNCIHNYPSYHNWLKTFSDREVLLVGIHTPEVAGEHNVETLRKKVTENSLNFPIIVDNDKDNWNAWGNSMWPTVYLIDKQGYVRYWWLGELNWKGQEGEKLFTKRIEELLKE